MPADSSRLVAVLVIVLAMIAIAGGAYYVITSNAKANAAIVTATNSPASNAPATTDPTTPPAQTGCPGNAALAPRQPCPDGWQGDGTSLSPCMYFDDDGNEADCSPASFYPTPGCLNPPGQG